MASSPPPPPPGTGSNSHEASSSVTAASADGQLPRWRVPRSLPPWLDSYEERYGTATNDQWRLLHPPERSVPPHHNTTPGELKRRVSKDGFVEWDDPQLGAAQGSRGRIPHILRYGRASMRGRKWDHLRTAEPVIVPGYSRAYAQPAMAWQEFVHSSAYGHIANEESEVVDPEVLDKLQPNFNHPVEIPTNPLDARASRRRRTLTLSKRIWIVVMRHPLSPLLFRLTVMITSMLALGVAAKIFRLENSFDTDSAERTQSVVAVVVDCVAIPYIAYMIWDEYTGKPLGLRSANFKMSLILLDLFFIIFKSAGTALAFESLVYHNLKESAVRKYSRALVSFMLIGLIAWTMTFAVNIFRTVQRLGGGEDS